MQIPKCEDESDGPLPDPHGDCNKYYVCELQDDGKVEERNEFCAPDYHFSEYDLTCLPPDEALCSEEFRNLTCARENQRLSHPTNCSRYYKCSSTLRPIIQFCTGDLHFSSDLGDCVAKEVARCDGYYDDSLSCGLYDNPMRPTLLPDPTNCAAFYKCHNGRPIPMFCPNYLHFSVVKKRCEFPFDVECRNGVRPKIF